MFTMEDRRALIGNNCHLAVNIKSARLLNPGNSLQQQIQLAAGSETIVRSSKDAPRIEYEQIFTSPWCCDASEESQYRAMMESLTSLNMDDGECTLFLLAAMFDTSGKSFISHIQGVPSQNVFFKRAKNVRKSICR